LKANAASARRLHSRQPGCAPGFLLAQESFLITLTQVAGFENACSRKTSYLLLRIFEAGWDLLIGLFEPLVVTHLRRLTMRSMHSSIRLGSVLLEFPLSAGMLADSGQISDGLVTRQN
jgi:hypothetical protein